MQFHRFIFYFRLKVSLTKQDTFWAAKQRKSKSQTIIERGCAIQYAPTISLHF